jgi:ankyrin repeat protein
MTSLLSTIYGNGHDLMAQVAELIAGGADVDATTEYSESPLRVASRFGRFDVVDLLLTAGANPYQLEWNDVTYAVIYGSLDDITSKVDGGGDLESRDSWGRTPFLIAVLLGDTAKTAHLLALGAKLDAVGRCAKTSLQYAVQGGSVPMLHWLLQQCVPVDIADEFQETALMSAAELGVADCLTFLIENGADIGKVNHIPESAIRQATTLESVKILLAHGADINELSPEMHAALLGVAHHAEPQASRKEYLAGRTVRFGASNPEKIDDPFRLAMIRSGASAWQAEKALSRGDDTDERPTWTYERFGRTTTLLADGRIVEIGGEHEDYYDPDFCIYNDVTVFLPDGEIRHFGYPEIVFPPTDFHTATVLGDSIIIVGSLGNRDALSVGHTPLFRLDLTTLAIEEINCTGQGPGWISKHKAVLNEDGQIVIKGGQVAVTADGPLVENLDEWTLDTTDWRWLRSTDRGWRQWNFVRKDRQHNRLWEIRQAIWSRNAGWKAEYQKEVTALVDALGHEPDLGLVPSLYQVDSNDASANFEGSVKRAVVDGVAIRIVESGRMVHAVAEGVLSDASLQAYQETVLERLGRLEGAEWEVLALGAAPDIPEGCGGKM